MTIVNHFGPSTTPSTSAHCILYIYIPYNAGAQEGMLLQRFRPMQEKRMTVRLRIMLLMPMLMETECGLRTSSFTRGRKWSMKTITGGTKEKGRRLQN